MRACVCVKCRVRMSKKKSQNTAVCHNERAGTLFGLGTRWFAFPCNTKHTETSLWFISVVRIKLKKSNICSVKLSTTFKKDNYTHRTHKVLELKSIVFVKMISTSVLTDIFGRCVCSVMERKLMWQRGETLWRGFREQTAEPSASTSLVPTGNAAVRRKRVRPGCWWTSLQSTGPPYLHTMHMDPEHVPGAKINKWKCLRKWGGKKERQFLVVGFV